MVDFRAKQAGVFASMMVGLAVTVGAFFIPRLPHVAPDMAGRLSLWLACGLVLLMWVVIGVGRLANYRFFSAEDIDAAARPTGSDRARVLQAQLQNSIEQMVIAFVTYGAWLLLAPTSTHGLVIVFSLYFSVGRLLFLVGYSRGAAFRALGFTLSFYPSVAMILLILPRAVALLVSGIG